MGDRFLRTISLSVALCSVGFACSKPSPSGEAEGPLDPLLPDNNPSIPTNVVVHPDCQDVSRQIDSVTQNEKQAEVAIHLRDVPDNPEIEYAVLSLDNKLLPAERLCTNHPSSVLLQLSTQHTGTQILLRENQSKKFFSLSEIDWKIGKRVVFGDIAGRAGLSFAGNVDHRSPESVHGQISPLNWKFRVSRDGRFSSGVLPAGLWSFNLADQDGNAARWTNQNLISSDVNIGSVRLATKTETLSPMWQGSLRNPKASYLIGAPDSAAEMRISLAPDFAYAFWRPLTQVVQISIPKSGTHVVYAQLRHADGELGDLLVHQLNAEILDLTSEADAKLAEPTVSLFNPATTVSTVPPQGAVEHSLTIDIEDLPRVWSSVSAPLSISLPKSIESCGRHSVYVRFRDATGLESESLTRTLNVSCWENTVPVSPLAPRFGHAAAAIQLNPDSNGPDATLIWGGRNATQLFNDGAILKQDSNGWVWQSLPSPPEVLSARTRLSLAVGKNHVLFHGGEDLTGSPSSGWALLDLRAMQWKTPSDFTSELNTPPPSGLKHAAVGYVTDLNPSFSNGMFFVVGGELHQGDGTVTISDKYYALLELNGEVGEKWVEETAPRAIARATAGTGGHPGLFYIHGGISTPSGTSETKKDLSGDDFELSADLQVFAFETSTDPEGNASQEFISHIYKANDSRTGALSGHAFFLRRRLPSNPSRGLLIESQVMCVYGAQKYADELTNVCDGMTPDGKLKFYQPFCRRLYDSAIFAPVGRLGLCLEAARPSAQTPTVSHLRNFYLAIDGAPSQRRLPQQSSASLNGSSLKSAFFFWSGMSPTSSEFLGSPSLIETNSIANVTGGEFLADGKIYNSGNDRWVPITQFQAPAPRTDHSATYMTNHERVLIWGGRTAAGLASGGAFYALPFD